MNVVKPDDDRGRLTEERVGGLPAYLLSAGAAAASIVAGAGGLTRSVALCASTAGSQPLDILEGPTDSEIVFDPWFRSRVLCPFNDRIPKGSYIWKGTEYRLPINAPEDGSAIHGLVYNRAFQRVVDECTPFDSSADPMTVAHLCLQTRLSRGEVDGYPFDLAISLRYTLTAFTFSFEIAVRNTGGATAPLSFGWHPYFTLGARIDSLTLQMDSEGYLPVDASLNPTGEIESVTGTEVDFRRPRPIGSQTVDLALTAPSDGRIRLSSRDHSLTIELLGGAFGFVQLFSHPSRKAIAIEPITAGTNAFNIPGLGLRLLEPGAACSGGVRITRTA